MKYSFINNNFFYYNNKDIKIYILYCLHYSNEEIKNYNIKFNFCIILYSIFTYSIFILNSVCIFMHMYILI